MNTEQIAVKLGVTRVEILAIVNRNPQLRPSQRTGHGYLWNEEEIQALQAYLRVQKREYLKVK